MQKSNVFIFFNFCLNNSPCAYYNYISYIGQIATKKAFSITTMQSDVAWNSLKTTNALYTVFSNVADCGSYIALLT